MTLHEAIIYVLRKSKKPLSSKEIALILNKENLYSRNDNTEIPAAQVRIRVNHYPQLFQVDDKGYITVKKDQASELLDEAWKIQKKLIVPFQGMETYWRSDYIVPFLFFFKRMRDNSDLSNRFLGLSISKNKDLIEALDEFFLHPNIKTILEPEFTQELNELKSSKNHSSNVLPILFDCINSLKEIDLSVENISTKEFGTFFNDLNCSIVRQSLLSGQYSTPKTIGKLIFELCRNELRSQPKLYNPGTGYASIPALFAQMSGERIRFYGEEINQKAFAISKMNLIANDISTENFYNSDSFTQHHDLNQKFDVIICNPPFGKDKGNQMNMQISSKKASRDFTLRFIYHILSVLSQTGKAIIVAPENILFNKSTEYLEFREKVIKDKLLEGVISLPAGLFTPQVGIKTNLLVLSRKANDSVIFIDAEDNAFHSVDPNGNILLNQQAIGQEYNNLLSHSGMVMEPAAAYGKSRSVDIPLNTIVNNLHDLSIGRYLLVEEKDENKIELGTVLTPYYGGPYSRMDVKYVNISDLNNTFYDINLKEELLSTVKNTKNGRILDIPALLISSIPPNVKATYFKNEGLPVVVSSNIHTFRINSSQVDIQYLIFELNSDYVQAYLSAISSGTTSLRRFSADDFLKLKIVLPDLEKQKEIVKLKMEAILAEKARDFNSFMENSGLTVKSEKEILGFVKHEIGNLTGGISNNFSLIEHFLRTKNLDFSEKISVRQGAPTLEKVFKSLTSSIKDINDMMKNIQNIIDFGNRELKLGLLNFQRYIQQEVEKYSLLLNENNAEILIGIENIYQLQSNQEIEIDPVQFSVVIRNFIDNSIKHGYSSPSQQKTLVINLNTDADFYYLHLANDGDPFPEGFKLEDFVSFGGRMNMSKGSGLGGFLINKVILNHKGSIELMESGKALFLSNVGERNPQEKVRQIKTGVHFLIIIPKIN